MSVEDALADAVDLLTRRVVEVPLAPSNSS